MQRSSCVHPVLQAPPAARSIIVARSGGIDDVLTSSGGAGRRRGRLLQTTTSSSSSSSSSSSDTGTGTRRRRRLFADFQDDPVHPSQQLDQQQDQHQHDHHHHHHNHHQQQQQQQDKQQPQQQQPQQPRWWKDARASKLLRVFVYWDLDNLQPPTWTQTADLVASLRASLRPFGAVQRVTAYANRATLSPLVAEEELLEEVEADELRCSICGRRCKSFAELRKHFEQLHQREHSKKLRAPKKQAGKYAKSDKAQRVREAKLTLGTTKPSRSGRKGQMVKVLLQRAHVSCFEVPQQPQAADEAITRHILQLRADIRDGKMPSAQAGLGPQATMVAAAEAEDDGQPPQPPCMEECVLVIVSDDRGFAGTIAGHLGARGAGAVLVTSRPAAEWRVPLANACGRAGCGARSADVAFVDWDDLVPDDEPGWAYDEELDLWGPWDR